MTPLLLLSWWWTEEFLLLTGQDPELARAAGVYARWVSPSAPFLMAFTVCRQWLQGRRILKPILFHALWANLLNVGLNWAFIYGHVGAPELGLQGAALATSVTRTAMAIALVVYIIRKQADNAPRLGWSPAAYDRRAIKALFVLGLPVAFQVTFEIGAFGLATLFAGKLGTTATSAHLVVLNISSITFMVPLGIGLAASTRVGNLIGEKRLDQAKVAARWAFVMATVSMTVFALIFYFCRQELPRLYTRTGELDVRIIAASILPVAAAFQIFDGIQVVGTGVLRGAGQTRPAAVFNLIGYWLLGLPLGYYLTFHTDLGVRGIWWGLALGLACVAGAVLVWWKRTALEQIGRLETEPNI